MYQFELSTDLKETGSYPQLSLHNWLDKSYANSHLHVEVNEFPDFVPEVTLKLNPGAKLTSILSVIDLNFGFIMDEKAKSVFSQFHLPPHAFYPIQVLVGNRKEIFFWFHLIVNNFWELIDKQNSEGGIFKIMNRYEPEHTFALEGKDFIQEKHNSLKIGYELRIIKLAFNEEFHYDLYEVCDLEYKLLVSSKLRDRLQKEKITGYSLKPIPDISARYDRC